ncbi:flagellar basal body-associated FliL family protein [Hydrogenothermus marinus]|uniref:Flagellar protein FliL n=1 Tax=Hydrogenothermus marinus TaxID=133270 RepID=A0A3M0C3D6_9AQUI|nr:flagellar basal body-associated FliL family protein [Hydrogenothermus marinus]RMA97482.1 flagellar FliL protein [Hydrogenothermus marinus]
MANENQENLENQEQKGGGKKKLLLFLLIFLIIAGAGGFAAYKFVFSKGEEKKEEKKAEKIVKDVKNIEQPGIMYDLGTFIVNLADRDADRYLKITIVLEVENEQVKMEVDKRLPQIKDTITTLLLTKTSEEIKTAEGMELLKEEIIKRVNAILPLGGVKNVYFTEFVIQTA